MKSIIVKIDYFGRFPDWFPLFLESCRTNPSLSWHIHTDCPLPEVYPPNVKFTTMSYDSYCEMVSDVLGVRFKPYHPYNIVSLKPIFGTIHRDIVSGFDFFACSDIDLIYGDIRKIYTDNVLTHNVISSHAGILSGHFALFKNEAWICEAYRRIPRWREILENPYYVEWKDLIDEAHMTAMFSSNAKTREDFFKLCGTAAPNAEYYENNFFQEQWSTPFTPEPWHDGRANHPDTWFWNNGRLTNTDDGSREFLYLHFMNFRNKHYVNEALYADALTWDRLDGCMSFDMADYHMRPLSERIVRIDRNGIHLDR